MKKSASITNWWVCPYCGKRTYRSRRDAKRAGALAHPGEKGMSGYECTDVPDNVETPHFHYGHHRGVLRNLKNLHHARDEEGDQ